jgi:DNA-binding MurR/RpiR family transcriptional regulator
LTFIDVEDLVPDPASLPRQQARIAEFLLSRPEVLAFGNLRTVESMLGVSSITIIRFAKRIGFSGFQGLQAAVREDYLRRAGFGRFETPALPDGDGARIVASTMEQQRRNVDTALAALREEDLQRVAGTLIGARRILTFGTGSAGLVARLLVRLLRHVGIRGEYIEHAGVDEVIAMRDITADDAVVAISLWLNFSESANTLRMAKRRGAATIALVGGNGSALAALADQSLYAPGQGVALPFSLTAHVALVECVVAAVASQRTREVAAIWQELHELYIEEGLIATMERHNRKNGSDD